ncbi:hypothetical protein [Paraburkholderia unamae]|nr:hypothetical protein [Paraburkholderia unamae]
MSRIVAARFTTFAAADSAKERLLSGGFIAEDLTEFFVNPSGQHARFPIGGDEYADPQARGAGMGATGGVAIGAVVGVLLAGLLTLWLFRSLLILTVATAVGAYVGSLAGAVLMTRGGGKTGASASPQPRERESGVLVAVHVNPEVQSHAIEALRRSRGEDIEVASGHWQNGRWVDFDPTRAVNLVDERSIRTTAN